VNGLAKEIPDYGIISEEMGEIVSIKNDYFFVVDPVDGSYNFLKRIGGAGCSIALFDYFQKDLRNVFCAFVGNYFNGDMFFTERNFRACQNYNIIHSSTVSSVSEAIAGVNFDFDNQIKRFSIIASITKELAVGITKTFSY